MTPFEQAQQVLAKIIEEYPKRGGDTLQPWIDNLTVAQMGEYIATTNLKYEDPAQFMGIAWMRYRAAAHAYAGKNPMAHHYKPITEGGWAGFGQMMANRGNVASAKLAAGENLVIARLNRALGYKGPAVFEYLETAARARRAAYLRSQGVAA